MWQDLWSQCCEGAYVPSRSILRLKCCGCEEIAPVWGHQCASVPSVGRAEKVPVGGGPKPDGRYATLGNCRRVPGR